MVRIQRALISVSDKTGIVDFVKELDKLGVEILSTGGTAKLLHDSGIKVKEVSEYTGFPEMLDGRVKTLHPKIHAGLLALRHNTQHMQTLKEHAIGCIDMVVVNLYPFERTIAKPGVSIEEAIENIDIGGPSMLRSAAKNHLDVAVLCNPGRYNKIISELKRNKCRLSRQLLRDLAVEVFALTGAYDSAIHNYLRGHFKKEQASPSFPQELVISFDKIQDLRYGENAHQRAAFYRQAKKTAGLAAMKQLGGKELSFNNILDLNAAANIVKEFELPAAVFIKHNNPCGVAENRDLLKAYQDSWACDKLSAFGAIVSVNRKIELPLAKLIAKSGFLECVICPEFSPQAVSVLKEKKNLRLLELKDLCRKNSEFDFRKVEGGLLLQEDDDITLDQNSLKVVTKKRPTAAQMQSLIFAWKVAKHTKSNAIILARGSKTVGIGAGQMSRVDSVFIAAKKAGKFTQGSCLASDAFFPKEDAITLAARIKVKAIIQPGGSIADEEIIRAADKHKIAMVTTGIRHFRH
ncbi:MAG: bifunctional phosphoribosylaminoimidazolecarboxamide formyltransferase/IMP cyclohydrolase [Candidatus Omnitrophica bacterium]|nr:bifunctional phosphoribosylaminoimidazolecarboxamide formyltransferase/IMP cyclohydrolase [Candidatus Omnitrophota bacterium]